MSLDGAQSIATGGLAIINRQMAIVSQNIANASTPDYAAERATQSSVTADGMALGVISGATRRSIDTALQAQVLQTGATVAELGTTASALRSIDAALGTPGQGDDLPSLVGDLGNQFSALLGGPENQAQQARVVASAGTLTQSLNRLSDAYAQQRQAAHDDIIASLATLNQALDTIGALSNRIIALKAGGNSTSDLENQRDAALHTVCDLVSAKALVQTSGDMLVVTTAGLSLPTRRGADGISLAGANLQPDMFHPGGGVPGIMIGGHDVTTQMLGGRIGADLALRDRTLPTFQAELDEFAYTLATRFSAQGLTLFTGPDGTVPAGSGTPAQSGYIGFAGTIGVNPSVQADARLVRDGTDAVTDNPAGASGFTPNPSGGPAGFTTLIDRVLTYALGTDIRSGVAQPASATTGLGPTGGLSAPYAAPATLLGLASAVATAQASESAGAAAELETRQALHASLSSRLEAGSGVDIDAEMSLMLSLQTAYSANARVMTVVQGLFTELMNSVR
ncbi:MAG: flagellar hook-associated protein FlgK [Acetobacteraceae bacterium]